MKTKTDLHAGGFIQDAFGYINDALASINHFLTEADEEAETLFSQAVASTKSVWEKFTNIF